MSLFNRTNTWTSLLALILFQRRMNSLFVLAVHFVRGVNRLHDASIEIAVGFRDMTGCGICAIGHKSLEM